MFNVTPLQEIDTDSYLFSDLEHKVLPEIPQTPVFWTCGSWAPAGLLPLSRLLPSPSALSESMREMSPPATQAAVPWASLGWLKGQCLLSSHGCKTHGPSQQQQLQQQKSVLQYSGIGDIVSSDFHMFWTAALTTDVKNGGKQSHVKNISVYLSGE